MLLGGLATVVAAQEADRQAEPANSATSVWTWKRAADSRVNSVNLAPDKQTLWVLDGPRGRFR